MEPVRRVSDRLRRVGGVYLAVQGLGVLGFWVWLLAEPGRMAWFVPEGMPGRVFVVFLAADIGVLAVSSLVAAWGFQGRARWRRVVLALHVGAAEYAGLCAVMLWILDPGRWLGVLMMLPVMVVPACLLVWTGREGIGSAERGA